MTPSFISLKVYNLLGQEVGTLVDGHHASGEYRFQWNPVHLPNGVYVYRLQAGEFVETQKLVLLK
ncbi:MAG: T9SS type A sorting domain-containing protein [bacterium]